jgi:hypothetical protein
MVIAMLALISGLAGTAVALQGKNSVKSNDIAPKAVKGSDIDKNAVSGQKLRKGAVNGSKVKDGSLSSGDLDVFRTGAATPEVTTVSGPPTALAGDPQVQVTVKQNGLIGIYARAEMRAQGGGNDGRAQVHLYEPALLPNSPRIMQADRGGGFEFRYTAPGTGDTEGTGAVTRGGMIVIPAPPGTYTFSLRYSQAGQSTAAFRNRAIWAGVIN